jgi:NAD(P)-dependent dehydrogenase (short-subunit alcohol dehydrogenase family)
MNTESTKDRLKGQIALITGASRGIGKACALKLAAQGAHCILVATTTGGLEEVDDEINALGGSATLVPMDVTDYPAIDRLGASLFERYGKLDILVGNAGILGKLSPVGHIDPKDWDKVLAVNLTANWRLLRSMDPLLRQSHGGRVVMVTSSVAAKPRAYWSIYAVSKAGLENLTLMYGEEVLKTNIKVNLLDPGGTATRMRAEAFPGEDQATLKTPDDVAETILELCLPECTHHGELIIVS